MTSDPAWGLPLLISGLVMLLMGWQLHKLAIPFSYLIVGLVAGFMLFRETHIQLAVGGISGAILAALSFVSIRYAVAVLGGAAGGFALSSYITVFESLPSPEIIIWVAAGVGFLAGAALAFISLRETICIVTSFLGSMMLVSGLCSLTPRYIPDLFDTVSSFLVDYPALAFPFLVGGPTFIGVLIQIAGINKTGSGAQ